MEVARDPITTRSPIVTNVQPLFPESERQAVLITDLRLLHALSLRLASSDDVTAVLGDVLRSAAALVGAPLGSVQLLTSEGALGMVGQIGFGDIIREKFATVGMEDCSTCAAALRMKSRIIVPDLRADPKFTEIAAALMSYGAVAAVSTPLLDSAGNVMAMFSLYWYDQHEPDEREIALLDLCAELAGRHVERSRAGARQSLLMRELAHRGKNLIAVIQAIATRTLSGDRTLKDAREVFVGRLRALANTYGTLTEDAPEAAQLHTIVATGLESFSERARIHGPGVVVSAKAAQTLALAIHELATNAAKYGALSVESGRLEVCWEVDSQAGGDVFRFKWTETGGPPAKPPAAKGFGSTIITTIVGSELVCVPVTTYDTDGCRYQFECLLSVLRPA